MYCTECRIQGFQGLLKNLQNFSLKFKNFKDFNDRHEIQGFFKGCGNPVRAIPKKKNRKEKTIFDTPSLRSTASRLRRSRSDGSAALGLSPTSRHDPSFFRPADTPYFRHVSDLDLWLPDYLCWRRLNCKSKGLCSSDLVLVVYTCYWIITLYNRKQ